VISEGDGSWISHLHIDGKVFWTIDDKAIEWQVPAEGLLPSDSSIRGDLIEICKGEMEIAEEEKVKLEVAQRADKALRIKAEKERTLNAK